jgi:hypothetical protein
VTAHKPERVSEGVPRSRVRACVVAAARLGVTRRMRQLRTGEAKLRRISARGAGGLWAVKIHTLGERDGYVGVVAWLPIGRIAGKGYG